MTNVGFVYFIEAGPFVKIGHSWKPERRVKQIAHSVPFPCALVGTIEGCTTQERDFQKQFAEFRAHGEWFHITGAVAEFIAKSFPRKSGQGSARP